MEIGDIVHRSEKIWLFKIAQLVPEFCNYPDLQTVMVQSQCARTRRYIAATKSGSKVTAFCCSI
jgi:hypothetical protein